MHEGHQRTAAPHPLVVERPVNVLCHLAFFRWPASTDTALPCVTPCRVRIAAPIYPNSSPGNFGGRRFPSQDTTNRQARSERRAQACTAHRSCIVMVSCQDRKSTRLNSSHLG